MRRSDFFFKWQAPFQQYFLSTSTSGRPLQHQLCCNWINPDAFICCLMLQLDKLFASRCTNGALSRGSAMGLVRKTAFFFFAENSQYQSSLFDHQLSFSGPALHDDPSAAAYHIQAKKSAFCPKTWVYRGVRMKRCCTFIFKTPVEGYK